MSSSICHHSQQHQTGPIFNNPCENEMSASSVGADVRARQISVSCPFLEADKCDNDR